MAFLRFSATTAYRKLFLNSLAQPSFLEHLGINNRWPHIHIIPLLAPGVGRMLDICLLSLKKPITNSQIHLFDNHRLYVTAADWKGRTPPKCPQFIRRLRVRILQCHSSVLSTPRVGIVFPSNFRCPHGHVRPAAFPFDQFQDNTIWCSLCRCPFMSKRWVCACDISWRNCPLHYCSFSPLQPAARKRPALAPATPEASAQRLRLLEPSASSTMVLGPILSRRFPQIARSSNS